jgi:hypothetical protein
MKFAVIGGVGLSIVLLVGLQAQDRSANRGQGFEREHQPRVEYRSTAAIQEPSGFTAACFASNLDSEARVLTATIIDWRGNNVTATTSCGTNQGPGITCQSTASFTDSALRCVVSTTGSAARLRGSLGTSAGPYPFTLGQPTNATLAAE